jgi:hypothetical protein
MKTFQQITQRRSGLQISDRIPLALLVIAICWAPFYLIPKYLFSGGWVKFISWSFPGWIVIALFFLLFCEYAVKGVLKIISKIDLWMYIVLFYYLWLCFFALMMGGAQGLLSRFWQHVVGVLIYFLVRKYMNAERVMIMANIFGMLSLIVALAFLLEWLSVNVLGMHSSIFSVSRAMHEQELLGSYYVSTGGGSLSGKLTRIGGILGTYRCTALFISLGCLFFFFRMVFFRITIKAFGGCIVCLLAVLACNSRFTVFGLVGSILISYFFFIHGKNRKRMGRLLIALVSLFGIFIVVAGSTLRTLIAQWYFWSLIGEGPSSMQVQRHLNVLYDAIEAFVKAILANPLLSLTGHGFGDWSSSSGNLLYRSGDLGWASVHYYVGFFGIGIICFCLFWIMSQTYLIMRDKYLEDCFKYVCISSFCFVVTSIVSVFHGGSLYHNGNYFCFFAVIGLIGYIDEVRKKGYMATQ